jgi:hypothetical protein
VSKKVRERIEEQFKGEGDARRFVEVFRFELENPGLRDLEVSCRRRFGALGGTDQGWSSLCEAVGQWVSRRDEPWRGERIYLPDIYHAATWHNLRSTTQQFEVPAEYIPPPAAFR